MFGPADGSGTSPASEPSWRIRSLPLAVPPVPGLGAPPQDQQQPLLLFAGCLGDTRGPSFAPLAAVSVGPIPGGAASSGRRLACVSVLDLLELSADPQGPEADRLLELYCAAGDSLAPVARAGDAAGGCLIRLGAGPTTTDVHLVLWWADGTVRRLPLSGGGASAAPGAGAGAAHVVLPSPPLQVRAFRFTRDDSP